MRAGEGAIGEEGEGEGEGEAVGGEGGEAKRGERPAGRRGGARLALESIASWGAGMMYIRSMIMLIASFILIAIFILIASWGAGNLPLATPASRDMDHKSVCASFCINGFLGRG